jgi:hypothetical protein
MNAFYQRIGRNGRDTASSQFEFSFFWPDCFSQEKIFFKKIGNLPKIRRK